MERGITILIPCLVFDDINVHVRQRSFSPCYPAFVISAQFRQHVSTLFLLETVHLLEWDSIPWLMAFTESVEQLRDVMICCLCG